MASSTKQANLERRFLFCKKENGKREVQLSRPGLHYRLARLGRGILSLNIKKKIRAISRALKLCSQSRQGSSRPLGWNKGKQGRCTL